MYRQCVLMRTLRGEGSMTFSIIIPYYNQKREFLQECLNSISCNKNFNIKDNIEVILINDGGDNTDIDFTNYPFRIEHITYNKNRGPGYARNCGLEKANNDYVIFLDSDDLFILDAF